jgi:hypothetical protein
VELQKIHGPEKKTAMKVRTIVNCEDICPNLFEGSVLQNVVEKKKSYYGVFSSFMGSYYISIPKDRCEIVEDLEY